MKEISLAILQIIITSTAITLDFRQIESKRRGLRSLFDPSLSRKAFGITLNAYRSGTRNELKTL